MRVTTLHFTLIVESEALPRPLAQKVFFDVFDANAEKIVTTLAKSAFVSAVLALEEIGQMIPEDPRMTAIRGIRLKECGCPEDKGASHV